MNCKRVVSDEKVQHTICSYKHNWMSSIKFVHASQARNIYRYKNIKRKILKCCANLYFNKQCLKYDLVPRYTKIHVPHTSPSATYTQRKICKILVKDEIKFLYTKKKISTQKTNVTEVYYINIHSM